MSAANSTGYTTGAAIAKTATITGIRTESVWGA